MYKLIGALLFSCFLIADARYSLSLKSEVSQDVPSNSTDNKISYRLPESVKPNSYYIDLKVYLDENKDKNFTFSGTVNISLNVEEATKNITLHSKDLNIKDLNVAMVSDNFRQPIKVKYSLNETIGLYKDVDFVIITGKNSEEFEKGQYVLSITYEGKLNDDMNGFYRSHYVNNEGQDVWHAVTYFEPVSARRAFPCFDEPTLKATFQLKITHSNKLKAISNAKSTVATDNHDGTMTTEFEKTPLMSTYLLAFVVSDFKSIELAANNFTVYVRPNTEQLDNLTIQKGVEILKKLEDFTNVSFEIGKIDQIAVPQFPKGKGAMENWGLVTYSEDYLLKDDKKSSAQATQTLIVAIAHEFAHQWFGNLVSPKWWKYIWLNEGFATFFSYYIIDQVDKTFRSLEVSVIEAIQYALDTDSWYGSVALIKDAEKPEDIANLFDINLYYKGMAVVRMMQHYLTDELFKKGIQQYLNDFHHKTADSDDLFNSIQKVVDEEKPNIQVKAVMDAWIHEEGYPIVTVKRNYENNSMVLKQERFISYNRTVIENINNVWYIPVSYATEENHDFENTAANILFNKAEETFPIDNIKKDQWIILNKQVTGFYRVNYDEDSWKFIINYLNSPDREKIHPLNRAQLIDDAFAFVNNNILGLQTFMGLMSQLKYETDFIVWFSTKNVLQYFKSKLKNSEHYPFFKEYVLNAMTPFINSVGFEATDNDDHIKKLSRALIMKMACSVGHNDCLSLMQQKLEAWLKDKKRVVVLENLKYEMFCYGLQNASVSLWEEVFNKSNYSPYANDKSNMERALGCSSQKEILERLLNDSLANKTGIDLHSAMYHVLDGGNLFGNDVGLNVLLDFIGSNISKLHLNMDKDDTGLTIFHVAAEIRKEEHLTKLKAIRSSNSHIPERYLNKAVEKAEKNIN